MKTWWIGLGLLLAVGGGVTWALVGHARGHESTHRFVSIQRGSLESVVFFDDTDVQAMRKMAVLGSTVAKNLFPAGDAVGQQFRIRGEPSTVVGVLSAKGQTAQGSDQDDIVLAPYTTVQNRLSGFSRITQILANTGSSAAIAAARGEITAILRETHNLATNEADDFTVRYQSG